MQTSVGVNAVGGLVVKTHGFPFLAKALFDSLKLDQLEPSCSHRLITYEGGGGGENIYILPQRFPGIKPFC
jgi:hypothetical protein